MSENNTNSICCARWVKASERLPDKELGRVFAKHLGVKNNLHYIFNVWTLSSNAKTIEESDLINIEWLDESPSTFPTREQAETFANQFPNTMEGNRQMHGAIAMYDWIIEQINKTKP